MKYLNLNKNITYETLLDIPSLNLKVERAEKPERKWVNGIGYQQTGDMVSHLSLLIDCKVVAQSETHNGSIHSFVKSRLKALSSRRLDRAKQLYMQYEDTKRSGEELKDLLDLYMEGDYQ